MLSEEKTAEPISTSTTSAPTIRATVPTRSSSATSWFWRSAIISEPMVAASPIRFAISFEVVATLSLKTRLLTSSALK